MKLTAAQCPACGQVPALVDDLLRAAEGVLAADDRGQGVGYAEAMDRLREAVGSL